ncbi:MAG: photosystem P840 reaction-center cytochrome c-551 [Candidatus Chlorobium antarcticum]|jgi:photosystem P840 reaction center cytochrome c551|nr:photosystem P840 reaction-center cytochrome c-551 [Candidatus Chlorobium antarcticum]
MDNKKNGKLITLAIGGAAAMGILFFGVSFLTGFKVPAENISSVLTPLSSFAGWFMLIFCASLIIMGFGKMSSRISDRWFLSFPLSIVAIVAVMFALLWLRPSGILLSTTGRTTLEDGKYIRSTDELSAFLSQPAATTNVPVAPEGFDFDAASDLTTARCNKCHTMGSIEDALRTKFKKTGKIDIIVKRMQAYPGSNISDGDALDIMMFLTERY